MEGQTGIDSVTDNRRKIVVVAGARPQFVKAAVLARRAAGGGEIPALRQVLVHTGQHYDANMSEVFFRQLGLPEPAYHLEVGSASGPAQAARILERLEPVLRDERPAAVVVVGDTNSTLAAALAAVQCGLPVVHVEAGERIYRRARVPEEVNRVVTDHLARLCLTATRAAVANLAAEGIGGTRVRFTGDLHYDLFRWGIGQTELRTAGPETFGVRAGEFILATIHRAENTDDPARLAGLLEALDEAAMPVVMPLHPRTREAAAAAGFEPRGGLRIVEPMGYFDLIGMLAACRRCVTDSGGVIREAYFARRPSVVPMEGAYWPDVVNAGWSLVVGRDLARLREAMASFDAPDEWVEGLFGDGDAAGAILRAVGELVEGEMGETVWRPRPDAI